LRDPGSRDQSRLGRSSAAPDLPSYISSNLSAMASFFLIVQTQRGRPIGGEM
jgi:hypothetical protein